MKRLPLFLTTFLLIPFFAFAQTPELVKDIAPGIENSEPKRFASLNNSIFFIARNGSFDFKLYRSDGTEAGTVLVSDLGSGNNGIPFSQPSTNLVKIGNFMYYLTIESSNGATDFVRKLFRVGETGAPQLVATFDQEFFGPSNLVNIGNDLYWLAQGYQLWKSDGTTAGTQLLYQTNNVDLEKLEEIIVIDNEIFFTKKNDTGDFIFLNDEIEIWKSDGTPSGTQFYKKIVGNGLPNDCGGHQVSFFDFNGSLGYLLDGSSYCAYESTISIEGFTPFSLNHAPIGSLSITEPVLKDGKIYFVSSEYGSGIESDLRILNSNQVQSIFRFDEQILDLYSLNNGNILLRSWKNVWTSDGTAAGTKQILNFENGPQVKNFIPYGNGYIFFATNDTNGNAIWFTDGTVAGSRQLADFSTSSQVNPFRVIGEAIIVGDILYFNGNKGFDGEELYKLDLSQIPPEPICNNNLLTNPGFEDGFNGWTSTQSATISQDANSGNNAALLADGGERMYQFVAAEPNKEYVISGRAKSEGYVNTYMKFLTADWQPTGRGRSQLLEGNYEYFDQTFTAPADAAWIEVSFTASDGDLLIDDLCLSANGGTPPCTINTIISNIQCFDSGTPTDPSDDIFSTEVQVFGNGGGSQFRVDGYPNNPNLVYDYSTNVSFGNFPISGGDVTVTFTDIDNSNCSTSVTLIPPPTCSNASTSELTIIGNPCITDFPQSGRMVSVGFTVRNTGNTVSSGQKLYLYRSLNGRFISPNYIGEVNVPTLQPNEETLLTISGVDGNLIPETYTRPGITVPTQINGYFLSDEVAQFPSNLKSIDFYCRKFNSDLAIEITTDVPEYDATGEITFKLKASNNGSQTAYNVATYFIDDPRLGLVGLDAFLTVLGATLQTTSSGVQWVIPQLAAGAMQEIELTYQIFEPSVNADYTLEVDISSGHNIDTNISDDSDSFTFVKRGGPAGGDLVLTATGDPTIAAWSDGIAYFQITNQSGVVFENVQVTFDFDSNIRLVGGNEYTSTAGTTLSQSWTRNPVWNVGTMTAGNVKHVALKVYSITNSPMEIYGQISQATGIDVTSTPGNGTPPIVNEDDEVLWQINGGTPPARQADLTISNLNLNSTSVELGEVLNFNFDVANIGNEAVPGNFTIKSYISTDNSLSANDVQDGIITTGNFGAGSSSADVPGAATIPANLPQGDYYLILKVDADDEVTESNEGNNVISTPFTIGCICTTDYTPVCGSDGVTYSNSCVAECNGIFNYTPGECNLSGDIVDLEMIFSGLSSSSPAQWSFFTSTLTLTNTSSKNATGIEVDIKRADEVVYKGGDEYSASQGTFQDWGDEIWRVGDLAAGESATITINYFRLSANAFVNFAQISAIDQPDTDSTPGNGNCCISLEDDETIQSIGSAANNITNRAAVAENLGNEVFAIVGANPNPTTGRFNVEVFSNENQTSEMTIVDILGRPVLRKDVELNEGHNSIPIDLENRGTGMMMVKMTPFHPYLRQIRVMKVRD